MSAVLDVMLFSLAAISGYSAWQSLGEPAFVETHNRLRIPSSKEYIYWNAAFGSVKAINESVPWIVDDRTGKIFVGSVGFAGSFYTKKY